MGLTPGMSQAGGIIKVSEHSPYVSRIHARKQNTIWGFEPYEVSSERVQQLYYYIQLYTNLDLANILP